MMNKIYREEIDIAVAFSSGLNRLQTKKMNTEAEDEELHFDVPVLESENLMGPRDLLTNAQLHTFTPSKTNRALNPLRLLKRGLTPLLHVIKMTILFFLRFFKPYTLKLRQYFTAELSQAIALSLSESNNANESFKQAMLQNEQHLFSRIDNLQQEIRTVHGLLERMSDLKKTEKENNDTQRGLIVVGAGGHAKVCIELLQAMKEDIAYCIGSADSPDFCLDIPVLKGNHHLKSLRKEGHTRVFIAIGLNQLREELANLTLKLGYQLVNAISPQAMISPSAQLGTGIAIMSGVVIHAEAKVADLAIINTGASIDHDCQIGKAAHVAPQCALAGGVFVGHRSFLGIGCKVIPEIVIGNKVTIGAGSVLISNIQSGVTAVGVPARIIKSTSVRESKRGYYATDICSTT